MIPEIKDKIVSSQCGLHGVNSLLIWSLNFYFFPQTLGTLAIFSSLAHTRTERKPEFTTFAISITILPTSWGLTVLLCFLFLVLYFVTRALKI